MLEFIFEFLGTLFSETILPSILKYLGASTKWVFYLGRKKFALILKEQWNKRIGFFVLILLLYLLIRLILG